MRTLPREPWRGGQICGEQLEYGVLPGRLVFCGEPKKPGSPLCAQHDKEARLSNFGDLPEFAPGNALGIKIKDEGVHYTAWQNGRMIAFSIGRTVLEAHVGIGVLSWEPLDATEDPHGETPIPATEEEIKAWERS